ncbi:MAG: ATP-binding protein [Planctomycetes bacterium]|nr:ATP-binding protein [Planctomycetota bacterium]
METRYTLATGPGGTGEVVVEISDTGVGIAPSQLAAVFEPFVTSKKDGTGLGLPIAKRLIEQHSGTLSLTSTEGAGTRVTIRLPAVPALQNAEAR